MYQEILNKQKKVAVIGLGYVGLPIALAFAKKISVIGFDINEKRVEMMKNHIDPSNELEKEHFDNTDIQFTHKLEDLKEANFFIVAVPTPINEHNLPDLTPLIKSSETVGKVLKKGDYVVYESNPISWHIVNYMKLIVGECRFIIKRFPMFWSMKPIL